MKLPLLDMGSSPNVAVAGQGRAAKNGERTGGDAPDVFSAMLKADEGKPAKQEPGNDHFDGLTTATSRFFSLPEGQSSPGISRKAEEDAKTAATGETADDGLTSEPAGEKEHDPDLSVMDPPSSIPVKSDGIEPVTPTEREPSLDWKGQKAGPSAIAEAEAETEHRPSQPPGQPLPDTGEHRGIATAREVAASQSALSGTQHFARAGAGGEKASGPMAFATEIGSRGEAAGNSSVNPSAHAAVSRTPLQAIQAPANDNPAARGPAAESGSVRRAANDAHVAELGKAMGRPAEPDMATDRRSMTGGTVSAPVAAIGTTQAAPAASVPLASAAHTLSQAVGQHFTISRIQEFNGGNTRVLKLQLQPAHLGQLDIVIRGQNGRMSIEIQTGSDKAAAILDREKLSLRTALDDASLNIDALVIENARDRRGHLASPAQAGQQINDGNESGGRPDAQASNSGADQQRARRQSESFRSDGAQDSSGDHARDGAVPRPESGSGLRI